MENEKKNRKAYSFKDRFSYWFDNHLAKSSLSFIRIFVLVSLVVALLIGGLIILFGFNEEGETVSVFWNSVTTVINAWMPYFDEGSVGYLILMSLCAVVGVLFTSVLIGIITSALEEKLVDLKKGNSKVLESGHTVVLGFTPGEYTLLNQLILAAGDAPSCIVIAEDMGRDEMEDYLEENLEIPKNVRLICRTADITDPASLEKLALETSAMVVVSPAEDLKVTQAVLAASTLLKKNNAKDVRINANINSRRLSIPSSLAEKHHISTLRTKEVMARMIAHSCTQIGLCETFRETFNFEGCEFYLAELPDACGRPYKEIVPGLDNGIAAGIYHNGMALLNPDKDQVFQAGDRLIVFSEDLSSLVLKTDASDLKQDRAESLKSRADEDTNVLIIGNNGMLPVIINELPENVTVVSLLNPALSEKEEADVHDAAKLSDIRIAFYEEDLLKEDVLKHFAENAEHIVILSDREKEAEEADMEAIFLLLNFRDLRERFGFTYNITVEIREERHQKLAGDTDGTDFLVTSSMSSLLLSQLAENPELIGVFHELLSNQGNEFYLKSVSSMGAEGIRSVSSLRRLLLEDGYTLFGFLDKDHKSTFLLSPEEPLTLTEEDYLIVIGEK